MSKKKDDIEIIDFNSDSSKKSPKVKKIRNKRELNEYKKGGEDKISGPAPRRRSSSSDDDVIRGPQPRSKAGSAASGSTNKSANSSNKRTNAKRQPEVEKVNPRERRRQAKNKQNRKNTAAQPEEVITNRLRNVQFAVVMYAFLALFIALSVYFCYFMFFKSDDFINSPYNARLDKLAESIIRGNITDRNGEVLATTNENGSRSYPYGNMYAHAIGYDSNGMSGVELDGNFYMLKSHAFFIERIKNDLLGIKNKGDTVVTTLDHTLQEIAYDSMNYDGAVIAIEPSTGKILVMTSKPNFNPNTIESNWKELSSGDSSVLLNRATQGLYPPGSTFKIITALEYLQENANAASTTFDCKGKFTQDDYTIRCYHGETHGNQTFMEAFGNSCNVAFSQIGLGLNKNGLMSMTGQLLFNTTLPTRLSHTSTSKFSVDETTRDSLMMQTAIGQGQTVVTPLHMAMIASAICNDGKLMEPYILNSVTNYQGVNVKTFKSKTVDSILTQAQADTIEEYMRYVVTNGTATGLQSDKYEAYGKTGTAEFNDNKDDAHAWFVGYAKSGDKELAIAVVQEKGGSGSKTAVPIAKKVFDAYFSQP